MGPRSEGSVGSYSHISVELRAYLDVLCDEPPRDPQSASAALLGLGEARAVVTPHVAWGTLEARRRLCAIACENARAFVQDGSTPNRVDGVQ